MYQVSKLKLRIVNAHLGPEESCVISRGLNSSFPTKAASGSETRWFQALAASPASVQTSFLLLPFWASLARMFSTWIIYVKIVL